MDIKSFTLGPLENNSYLIFDQNERVGVVVDPTFDSEIIVAFAKEKKIKIEKIINTHCHFDHIAGNFTISKVFNAPLFISKRDYPLLKNGKEIANRFGLEMDASPEPFDFLKEGDVIGIGNFSLKVIETPGHTRGGLCFSTKGILFSGDTLFKESIGRTDLEGGDFSLLIKSIREKLFVLPKETIVYPGHGPKTSIGREIGFNPFLNGEKI